MLISVAEVAARWQLSERAVRNYCKQGRITGAELQGKTWFVPEEAEKPARKQRTVVPSALLKRLQYERVQHVKGGIYHTVQIELTYNSNHIEGSKLSHEQTRFIFETNTIGLENTVVNVDDIIETSNHFRAIDYIIDHAEAKLTEKFIKQLHWLLKSNTSDSDKSWFKVGDYKSLPNEVGGRSTTEPELVGREVKALLQKYNQQQQLTLTDLIAFHVAFERIHPFQDGNGCVGRLILFKECLKHKIVPFIITEELKLYYYRGLQEWTREPGYLLGTCEAAQERFKQYLDYYRMKY